MSDCGSDLDDALEGDPEKDDDPYIKGITETYLASVKDKLVKEILSHKMPDCYRAQTFWVNPPDHFLLLKSPWSLLMG